MEKNHINIVNPVGTNPTPPTGYHSYGKDTTGYYGLDESGNKTYLGNIPNENTITSIIFGALDSYFPSISLKEGQGYIKINTDQTSDSGRFTIQYTSNTLDKKFFLNGVEKIPKTLTNTQATIEALTGLPDPAYQGFVSYGSNEIEIQIGGKSFKYYLFIEEAGDYVIGLNLQERFSKYNEKFFANKQIITTNSAINLGTINTQNIYININPATVQDFNSTITLPTSPFDGQNIEFMFGGTITSGDVATTLGLPASVVFPANYTYDTTWTAYESFTLTYDSVIAKWKLNG